MKSTLLPVIVIGAVAGFFLPRGQEPMATVSEPVVKEETGRAPARSHPDRPSPAAGWGGETRLRPAANGHYYATAQVNGQPVEFVVDTGATTVALTVDDARRAGISVDLSRFEVVGTGASGPVRGQPVLIRTMSLNGKEARELPGAVLEGLEVSLLGQSFLSGYEEVRISGGEMVLR